MNTLLIFFFVIFSVTISFHLNDVEVDSKWESFKRTHGRNFISDDVEEMRKEIFEKNLRDISEHSMRYSRGLETYEMGVNQFSDLTVEEYRTMMLSNMLIPKVNRENVSHYYVTDLPEHVDWRKEGLVTGVKNQGMCGSCWAFSATGAMEGLKAKKSGTLVALSEQNLVDCSTDEGNNGCDGGYMDYAFDYVIKNGGIDTEESYPYFARDQDCKFKKESIGATISGYVDITKGDEKKLMEAVANVGPVSVGLDASHSSFAHYKSGIYEDNKCNPDYICHGVTVVGYGTENGVDYWLLKNSWSTEWGDNGYIKLVRNKDNHCGIASLASYPTV